VELAELQSRIEALYGARDRQRGVDGTFRWWIEEVGEVAKALRGGDPAELEHELGDALAGWPAWPTSSGSTWPRRSAATPATARAAAPPRAPARWPS
jgi:hypothetical protein